LSNLLFICSKNQWRSPTAELLFKDHPIHHARSAGTSDKARIRINEKLISWADVIFVMERRHKEILCQNFPSSLQNKTVVVLNIEDNYRFNDPELVEILRTGLSEYL
jgi:predicted protein tyrosine phosphatase